MVLPDTSRTTAFWFPLKPVPNVTKALVALSAVIEGDTEAVPLTVTMTPGVMVLPDMSRMTVCIKLDAPW